MDKMIGASLPGDHTTELYEHEIPEATGRKVLVEVKAATLCGSDKNLLYKGAFPLIRPRTQIAGHEGAGIVAETGEGCEYFHKGDRVIVYHAAGCGFCSYCRRGMYNLCVNSSGTYGFHKNGVLARYVLADEKDLISLPAEISFEDAAALACSFSSGYSAVKKAHVSGLDAVFVAGLGPVGLGILMNAKAMGANLLIASCDNEYRRDLAVQIGAADVVCTPDQAVETVMRFTEGRGVEKSFDASGTAEGRNTSLAVLRKYGLVTFMGEGEDFSVNGEAVLSLIHDQKQISGSWAVPLWEIEELMEMLIRWDLHPSDMITHTYPLSKIDEAFRTAVKEQCGKVLISPLDC